MELIGVGILIVALVALEGKMRDGDKKHRAVRESLSRK